MAKKSASTGVPTPGKKAAPKKAASSSSPAPAAKAPRVKKAEAVAKPKTVTAKVKAAPAKAAVTTKDAKPAKVSKTPKAGDAAKSPKASAAKVAKPKAKATKSSRADLSLDFSLPDFASAIEDPIGDTADGEGRYSAHEGEHHAESLAEMAAYREDTADDALEGTFEPTAEPGSSTLSADLPATPSHRAKPTRGKSASVKTGSESSTVEPRADEEHPAQADADSDAHLDRLQKILSQAGIASRRHAEEMIVAGRVTVNGQVVTQLGSKADPARDYIRVDGKPLPAAERHRYFMLNKPRGYVTTVSDPEGRPTVMEFFSKMRERLYPVGRLDYESEGLLLVTNDGELANQLTRAASGVEKTYLVKIAGRPTAEQLDSLRSGVLIERGAPGSEETQTAPARIRELRHGARSGPTRAGAENPWFEVVLIEGRNRELRKMFQSVGHFVEKIRRVGYGPLVLDLPPGQMRELTPEELTQLRRTAEGKLRPAAKPERFDSRRKDKPGRSFEPRPRRESGREFPPRREQNFDKRTEGRPDRREGGNFADRRPPARNREDRGPGSRPAPARSFSSGERGSRPFRKFDSGRPPGPGSRGPRFDSRREDDRGRTHRSDEARPDHPSGPSFDRNKERSFGHGPGRSFGAPRGDFSRAGAQDENERTDRGPKRFEPNRGRQGGQDRFGPQRGGFNRPRLDQDRSGPRREDSGRGEGRSFAPRSGRSSGPRPSGSHPSGSRPSGSRPAGSGFGRRDSSFRPQSRRGDFRPNAGPGARPNPRSGPRSPDAGSGAGSEAGFDKPRDNAPRRPSFDRPRKNFSPRPSGGGDRPRGGGPGRGPARSGNRGPGSRGPGARGPGSRGPGNRGRG